MAIRFKLNHVSAAICAAAASGLMLLPAAVNAADPAKPASVDKPMMSASNAERMSSSDRARTKQWSGDKDMLKSMLKAGQDKAFYAKALADHGYQITSINVDKPDRVEYEVVKDAHSYEVQIDFDKSSKASKVDIDANLWRADSTKAALRGTKLATAPTFADSNDRFSDRTRMKDWNSEKERLEKALSTGQDKAAYLAQLKKLGYQVTSTNDSEKDYLEFEIVKGSNSYEVQIDMQAGKGKKVDVTSNMWQSEATEKALADGNKSAAKAKS